jgi:hypothetical protein
VLPVSRVRAVRVDQVFQADPTADSLAVARACLVALVEVNPTPMHHRLASMLTAL